MKNCPWRSIIVFLNFFVKIQLKFNRKLAGLLLLFETEYFSWNFIATAESEDSGHYFNVLKDFGQFFFLTTIYASSAFARKLQKQNCSAFNFLIAFFLLHVFLKLNMTLVLFAMKCFCWKCWERDEWFRKKENKLANNGIRKRTQDMFRNFIRKHDSRMSKDLNVEGDNKLFFWISTFKVK